MPQRPKRAGETRSFCRILRHAEVGEIAIIALPIKALVLYFFDSRLLWRLRVSEPLRIRVLSVGS